MAASAGTRLPDEETLFHLIPLNEQAEAAVDHSDNSQYVSVSTEYGRKGLEVGYHVPTNPRGDVITSLGRDADLILNHAEDEDKKPPFVSARHVDFQLNMHSHVVMLRVLSPDPTSVSVVLRDSKDAGVDDVDMSGVDAPESYGCRETWGDSVLLYGRSYHINICHYKFNVIWVRKTPEELEALALQGQKTSVARAQRLPARERPTPKYPLYYIHKRSADNAGCRVRETPESRVLEQESDLATVHKALDNGDGHGIIVVTIKLSNFGAQRKDQVRSAIRREVKFLKQHRRDTILPCLGSKNFETDLPVFYFDLAEGNIWHLSTTQTILWSGDLSQRMLRQILDALEYLAENDMCHGSIEPEKILYYNYNDEGKSETEIDKYFFKLSHFGITKYAAKPRAQFRAPELWDDKEPDTAKMVTPKTDVWCLLAAYAATHPSTQWDMLQVSSLSALCKVMGKVGQMWPSLNPMATEDPTKRASATQMLSFLPKLKVPAQSPGAPSPAQSPSVPGPASPSLGAGGPTDDPADPGGRELEPAIIETFRYNMRDRTVRQRAEQRRNARPRPGQRRNRADQRRDARHRPY
ncbi:unnamed protein product [Clonostachys solani]|uniref:Protein kinase domain-containing protein n=1 Tax=Clonostachys solani TaxID=160281 RepID=A0A9N9WAU0_9HYPO|nr:unnamed protein product [Clonostachys solani]